VKTLHNYRHLNKGPKAFAIGRKLAYQLEHIDAWLDLQRNPAPDEEQARESRPAEPRRLPRHQPRGTRELNPAA
jgi:hypothetical protein